MSGVSVKLTLDQPAAYAITVPGHLDEYWTDWNGGLTVTVATENDGRPITTLSGTFDQAMLHGILRRLYALGLPIISVVASRGDIAS